MGAPNDNLFSFKRVRSGPFWLPAPDFWLQYPKDIKGAALAYLAGGFALHRRGGADGVRRFIHQPEVHAREILADDAESK
jgi:hypothetical protein